MAADFRSVYSQIACFQCSNWIQDICCNLGEYLQCTQNRICGHWLQLHYNIYSSILTESIKLGNWKHFPPAAAYIIRSRIQPIWILIETTWISNILNAQPLKQSETFFYKFQLIFAFHFPVLTQSKPWMTNFFLSTGHRIFSVPCLNEARWFSQVKYSV